MFVSIVDETKLPKANSVKFPFGHRQTNHTYILFGQTDCVGIYTAAITYFHICMLFNCQVFFNISIFVSGLGDVIGLLVLMLILIRWDEIIANVCKWSTLTCQLQKGNFNKFLKSTRFHVFFEMKMIYKRPYEMDDGLQRC